MESKLLIALALAAVAISGCQTQLAATAQYPGLETVASERACLSESTMALAIAHAVEEGAQRGEIAQHYRQPAYRAKASAVLDELYGGRTVEPLEYGQEKYLACIGEELEPPVREAVTTCYPLIETYYLALVGLRTETPLPTALAQTQATLRAQGVDPEVLTDAEAVFERVYREADEFGIAEQRREHFVACVGRQLR